MTARVPVNRRTNDITIVAVEVAHLPCEAAVAESNHRAIAYIRFGIGDGAGSGGHGLLCESRNSIIWYEIPIPPTLILIRYETEYP